tara:strand:+ start:12888 stop:13067 length:180 start_codon:yes stop_codon:yes gene_type:complete
MATDPKKDKKKRQTPSRKKIPKKLPIGGLRGGHEETTQRMKDREAKGAIRQTGIRKKNK